MDYKRPVGFLRSKTIRESVEGALPQMCEYILCRPRCTNTLPPMWNCLPHFALRFHIARSHRGGVMDNTDALAKTQIPCFLNSNPGFLHFGPSCWTRSASFLSSLHPAQTRFNPSMPPTKISVFKCCWNCGYDSATPTLAYKRPPCTGKVCRTTASGQ